MQRPARVIYMLPFDLQRDLHPAIFRPDPRPGTSRRKAARRAKKTQRIQWLRERTFADLYGMKGDGAVYPSLKKDEYLSRYNGDGRAWQGIKKLSNYKYENHFSNSETYYFWGNPNKSAPSALIMIDVDVQKALGRGSLKGAIAFAEYLKTLWPNMAYEVSTNGKGIHMYFVVSKFGKDAKEVNKELKRFWHYLQLKALDINADIENVEVKGFLPLREFDGRNILSMTYGTWAKLPRTIPYEALRCTTALTLDQLAACGDQVTEADELRIKQWLAKPDTRQDVVAGEPVKKKRVIAGSCSGKIVSEADLLRLDKFEEVAELIMGEETLACATRHVATKRDLAILLVILRSIHEQVGSDGSLPTERIKELWKKLYEGGDVDRGHCDSRVAAMRNVLSQAGHIDWKDNSYFWGETPATPGRCMRWRLTAGMFSLLRGLSSVFKEGEDSTPSRHNKFKISLPVGTGEFLLPKIAIRITDAWLPAAEYELDRMFKEKSAA